MGDPTRSRESDTHTTPAWVRVFGIIAVFLLLLLVLLLLGVFGGDHGPGRHLGSGNGNAVPDTNAHLASVAMPPGSGEGPATNPSPERGHG